VALVLRARAEEKPGMLDFEIHAGELGLHLALHATPDGQAQKSSHGIDPGHCLQDGDE
jgi:hypothetical protein